MYVCAVMGFNFNRGLLPGNKVSLEGRGGHRYAGIKALEKHFASVLYTKQYDTECVFV